MALSSLEGQDFPVYLLIFPHHLTFVFVDSVSIGSTGRMWAGRSFLLVSHKPDIVHIPTLAAWKSRGNVSVGILFSQIKLCSKSKEEGILAMTTLNAPRATVKTITQRCLLRLLRGTALQREIQPFWNWEALLCRAISLYFLCFKRKEYGCAIEGTVHFCGYCSVPVVELSWVELHCVWGLQLARVSSRHLSLSYCLWWRLSLHKVTYGKFPPQSEPFKGSLLGFVDFWTVSGADCAAIDTKHFLVGATFSNV